MKLPKRVFNSPLIRYANFKDRSSLNLIRITPPYKNGDCYAIYQTTSSPLCFNKMFKTYELAMESYKSMIDIASKASEVVSIGVTGNSEK